MKAAIRAVLMLAIVAVPVVIWAQTTPTAPPAAATQPVPATPVMPPPTPREDPLPMDLDGDGVVTAAEHAAGARALFEHMDLNHDERVTREEMITFQRQILGAALAPPRP
ncbi:hypothetical protein QLQ15_02525 [Lysobacter sp. LF1]|uniref:EF-hand domain-containing protein n=1 Tax=Lysobacter stagni TaxID=3045172 RepID=A0ABT6XCX7_9GAMM|nr:hypothetical protein [Lysobacter sp. LF1]MDI9237785.1 hypothetical protein [Lysobacter sp. LF1]